LISSLDHRPGPGVQGRVGVVEVGLHALGAGLLVAEQPAEGEAVAALAGNGRAPARSAPPGNDGILVLTEQLQWWLRRSVPGCGVGGPGDSLGETTAAAHECPAPWGDTFDLDLQGEAQERPDQHDQPEDGHVL
jgi:hypothetical protein